MKQRYRSLNDYFEQTGETHEAFAKVFGITPQYVSMMRAGKRQPSLKLALRINEYTGVPLEALLMDEVTA